MTVLLFFQVYKERLVYCHNFKTIFIATLRTSFQQVLETVNVVFSATSLPGQSIYYMFQHLSWVPHSALKLEYKARITKRVHEVPNCNERNTWEITCGPKFTNLKMFQTILGSMFPKKARNQRLHKQSQEKDQKTWVAVLGLHIASETFPALKSPSNGQIWWNLLQNDIQFLMNIFLHGCLINVKTFVFHWCSLFQGNVNSDVRNLKIIR